MNNQQVISLANQGPFLPSNEYLSTTQALTIADSLAGECLEFDNELDMAQFLDRFMEAITGQYQG